MTAEKTTWTKRLRAASFRGVSFGVEGSEASFGRHKIVHEFVGRDTPFTEDSGKKARKFSVTGFVVGKDYMRERDLIITACEKEGAGRLIHPYYGIKTVDCTGVTISESFDYGGMAKLSFSFVESGSPLFPQSTVDQVLDLVNTANELFNELIVEFSEAFSVLKVPSYVVDSAANMLEDFSSLILNSNAIGESLHSLSSMTDSIDDLVVNSKKLVHSPVKLAKSIKDLLTIHAENLTDKKIAIESLFSLSHAFSKLKHSDGITVSKMREMANLKALQAFIKGACISVASITVVNVIKAQEEKNNEKNVWILSSVDALKISESLIAQVDKVLSETKNDLVFSLLSDLRGKVFNVITSRITTPSKSVIELKDDIPALVLAYNWYDNLERVDNILHGNDSKHPAQLTGGSKIELI